jgi:hypothetical protein
MYLLKYGLPSQLPILAIEFLARVREFALLGWMLDYSET